MCFVLLVELETATGHSSALRGQLPFHRVWQQHEGHGSKSWGRDGGQMRQSFGFLLIFHLLINSLRALESASRSAASATVRRYIQMSLREAPPATWHVSLIRHRLSGL